MRAARRVAVALTLALGASACGGKSSKDDAAPQSGGTKPDGGHGGGPLTATGGVGEAGAATGGMASGGQSDGGVASGGTPSSNAGAQCSAPDGSMPLDSRTCLIDSDCAMLTLPGCCGAERVAGVAKYLVCSAVPPNCTAVDCIETQGFFTDDGEKTLDLSETRVRCQPGEPGAGLCTTSVVRSDTVTCGAALCDAGELCVHPASRGGPACFPLLDAGACPADTEFSLACDGAPGCREQLTPEPYCSAIPPGCGAPTACSCLPSDLCRTLQVCGVVMGRHVYCRLFAP